MAADAAKPPRSWASLARFVEDAVQQTGGLAFRELLVDPGRDTTIDTAVVVHAVRPFTSLGSRSSASIAERMVWVARNSRDLAVPTGISRISATSARPRPRW